MVHVLTLLPAVFFKFFKLWEGGEKRERKVYSESY